MTNSETLAREAFEEWLKQNEHKIECGSMSYEDNYCAGYQAATEEAEERIQQLEIYEDVYLGIAEKIEQEPMGSAGHDDPKTMLTNSVDASVSRMYDGWKRAQKLEKTLREYMENDIDRGIQGDGGFYDAKEYDLYKQAEEALKS